MKASAMFLIAFTTVILLTVVIFSAINVPFGWVFVFTTFGQLMLLLSVYRILKDDYQTIKAFEDLYEDHDIGDTFR